MRKIEIRPEAHANLPRDHKDVAGSAMFSADAWTQIARSLGLSGRELEIVRGTFDDKTEMEIAADLHISPSTIHTHVERLHHKLAIADRAQLLLRVMQEFIVLTAMPGSDLPPICPIRTARNCPLYP
jgi:DNA-binding NarL/FixJ family response regulator